MTTTSRRLAALAVPALLASTLVGCGLGGPPTDASEEAYCEAENGAFQSLGEQALEDQEEPDNSEIYDALQQQLEDLEETGTPEDMPDDAREGFEIYVDEASGLDEDEVTEALEAEGEDSEIVELDGDDQESVDAYREYASETCAEEAVPEP